MGNRFCFKHCSLKHGSALGLRRTRRIFSAELELPKGWTAGTRSEGKGQWGAGLSWGCRGVEPVRIPRLALENEFCLAKPPLKHTWKVRVLPAWYWAVNKLLLFKWRMMLLSPAFQGCWGVSLALRARQTWRSLALKLHTLKNANVCTYNKQCQCFVLLCLLHFTLGTDPAPPSDPPPNWG